MIKLTSKSFITHKKAESREDCQDAWYQNEEIGRYAVADGATRSFFPKEWAQLLVEHFCETALPFPKDDNWKAWMKPIQEKWYTGVAERVRNRPRFYLVESFVAQESAASTFIGLEFDKDKEEWQAIIIGDSCLFHINKLGDFKPYLVLNSNAFDNRPEAFTSFEKDNKFNPSFVRGCANPGDKFILATDALAKWVLQHREAGKFNSGLNRLLQIESGTQFLEFVESSRVDEDIRLVNDDVTLMTILVESPQHVEVEEDQSATFTSSEVEKGIHALSSTLRLLFWILLAGTLGFVVGGIVGGIVCFLILRVH